jgi:hypothetical protein
MSKQIIIENFYDELFRFFLDMLNYFNNMPRKNVNVNVVNQNVVHQHDYQNRKHKERKKKLEE